MKKYDPEAMVAISRYRVYFPTLPVEIQRDAYNCILLAKKREAR